MAAPASSSGTPHHSGCPAPQRSNSTRSTRYPAIAGLTRLIAPAASQDQQQHHGRAPAFRRRGAQRGEISRARKGESHSQADRRRGSDAQRTDTAQQQQTHGQREAIAGEHGDRRRGERQRRGFGARHHQEQQKQEARRQRIQREMHPTHPAGRSAPPASWRRHRSPESPPPAAPPGHRCSQRRPSPRYAAGCWRPTPATPAPRRVSRSVSGPKRHQRGARLAHPVKASSPGQRFHETPLVSWGQMSQRVDVGMGRNRSLLSRCCGRSFGVDPVPATGPRNSCGVVQMRGYRWSSACHPERPQAFRMLPVTHIRQAFGAASSGIAAWSTHPPNRNSRRAARGRTARAVLRTGIIELFGASNCTPDPTSQRNIR